jgi:hypothetical protein
MKKWRYTTGIFFALALDGGECSDSRSDPLFPDKRAPSIRWTFDWMDLTADLEIVNNLLSRYSH